MSIVATGNSLCAHDATGCTGEVLTGRGCERESTRSESGASILLDEECLYLGALHLLNGEFQATVGELVSFLGDASQLVEDEPSDGIVVVFLRQLQTQLPVDLVDAHQAVNLHRILVDFYEKWFCHPLVGKATDDLLDQFL